jgi:hypothetical protein
MIRCPRCGEKTKVLNTMEEIRRRICLSCALDFNTQEVLALNEFQQRTLKQKEVKEREEKPERPTAKERMARMVIAPPGTVVPGVGTVLGPAELRRIASQERARKKKLAEQ